MKIGFENKDVFGEVLQEIDLKGYQKYFFLRSPLVEMLSIVIF